MKLRASVCLLLLTTVVGLLLWAWQAGDINQLLHLAATVSSVT